MGDNGSSPPDRESESADGLELAKAMVKATARNSPAANRVRRAKKTRANPQFSGPRADARDPKLLAEALGQVIDERGWDADLHTQAIFAQWEKIVGAEVAQHCHPVRLEDTKLWVSADSTAWSTQLKLLASDLVRRINREVGQDTVTIVEIAGPQAPNWRRGLRVVRDGRGPRDTYG